MNKSVHQFLNQDYQGEKILHIYNDAPWMKFMFEHPEVRINNLGKRYDRVGEKFNAQIKYCFENFNPDFITFWSDDDIMMPHALSVMAKYWNNQKWLGFAGNWVISNEKSEPKVRLGIGHCSAMSCMSKDIFDEVGWFPPISPGEDVSFEERLKDNGFFNIEASSSTGRQETLPWRGRLDGAAPDLRSRSGPDVDGLRLTVRRVPPACSDPGRLSSRH